MDAPAGLMHLNFVDIARYQAETEKNMKKEEIYKQIEENLKNAGITASVIRVQPDPFGGWNIVVVADEFENYSFSKRKEIVLKGLESLVIEWLDLLTSREQEWTGELPAEIEPENLPFWPEAFAKSTAGSIEPLFPSDIEDDLKKPVIVSFYSLRGGVGRTTALAYTGRILAHKGWKVICVDMDLEAPGLPVILGKEKEITGDQGVVHLLFQLDKGEEIDPVKHLIRVVDDEEFYCLPAGVPDANYARILRFIDPLSWYQEERNPLRLLIERLREPSLPFTPDVILLDARTGLTPISAPLLFDLSDMATIVFFPHPQAKAGTEALVKALLSAKSMRQVEKQYLTPEPRFLISPIPDVQDAIEKYKNRALNWIGDWLSTINELRHDNFIEAEDITQFISYRVSLASSDKILEDKKVWSHYEPVSQWIEQLLPSSKEISLSSDIKKTKNTILTELSFSSGTAEFQEDFLNIFVETENMLKGMQSDIPLILGRKGTGKTALFRRLLEDSQLKTVAVQAPLQLKQFKWMFGPDEFKTIEMYDIKWRNFWALYTFLSLYNNIDVKIKKQVQTFIPEQIYNKTDVIKFCSEFFSDPMNAVQLKEYFEQLDSVLEDKIILLYDGLDTGFGSSDEDRKRRKKAIAGLFDFWMNLEGELSNIKYKIFLREDIWRKVNFENKSHFYGRSIVLRWKSQHTFFKVALKQALRSKNFQKVVSEILNLNGDQKQIDKWTEKEVFEVWNFLVGERMKGGKTAYTRNWVWKRLADGNNDHSPRYLLQLFHSSTKREIELKQKKPYEKSIIRPRALMESLPDVSQEALGAIKEEFQELEPVLSYLQNSGRTPIPSKELEDLPSELVSLAREVGLLAVYEGTEESIKRYRVPELYRHALQMTRKGQM